MTPRRSETDPPIPFRFRKGRDDDLKAEFQARVDLYGVDKSDVIRTALRAYLFNTSVMQPESIRISEILSPDDGQTPLRQPKNSLAMETTEIRLEKVTRTPEDQTRKLDDLLGQY
jgi:hypothetical protein